MHQQQPPDHAARASRVHDWSRTIAVPQGKRAATCIESIRGILRECGRVEALEGKHPLQTKGVDYIAYLRGGRQLYIDHKSREPGCSRYWKDGQPELALERWSVVPDHSRGTKGVIGWTLDECKVSDLILFDFDPRDSDTVYAIPFTHLRLASIDHLDYWQKRFGGLRIQETPGDRGSWRSACVFIPAGEVLEAVYDTMTYNSAA